MADEECETNISDSEEKKEDETNEEPVENGMEDGVDDDDVEIDGEAARNAFSLFDSDGSGMISAAELGTALRALGHNPTDQEVDELLESVDKNSDGQLSYDEFEGMLKQRCKATKGVDQQEFFREAFKVFDADASGKIAKDELRTVITSKGSMKLSEEEADELISGVDADGDGLIDYEEFIVMFTQKSF